MAIGYVSLEFINPRHLPSLLRTNNSARSRMSASTISFVQASYAAYTPAPTLVPAFTAATKPVAKKARQSTAAAALPRAARTSQHPPMSSMLSFRRPPLTPSFYIESRRAYSSAGHRVAALLPPPAQAYKPGPSPPPTPASKLAYKSAERK